MFQLGHSLRFPLEALDILLVGAVGAVDNLDGYIALEAHIAAQIDASHPTLPQERYDLIFVKAMADQRVVHGSTTSQLPASMAQRPASSPCHRTRNCSTPSRCVQKTRLSCGSSVTMAL